MKKYRVVGMMKKLLFLFLIMCSQFVYGKPYILDGKAYDYTETSYQQNKKLCCYTTIYLASTLLIQFMDKETIVEDLQNEARKITNNWKEENIIKEIDVIDNYDNLNEVLICIANEIIDIDKEEANSLCHENNSE